MSNRLPLALTVSATALLIACAKTPAAPDVALPKLHFEIDRTRSDPYRAARRFGAPYDGPLYDVQAHLRRPGGGRRKGYLDRILATMDELGVRRLHVMGTPNSGRRRSHGKEARYRRRLAEKSDRRVRTVCGGNYSYWMHRAWREGFRESELNLMLDRLHRAIDGGACAGLGEIGLQHFDKNGRQPVILYPPDFAPFVKLVGVAASKRVWLTVHAEPVTPDGLSYENRLFGGIALLFRTYPGLKLILAHTAMVNTINARRLLLTYPGLMMDLKTIHRHRNWRNLTHHRRKSSPLRRLGAAHGRVSETLPGGHRCQVRPRAAPLSPVPLRGRGDAHQSRAGQPEAESSAQDRLAKRGPHIRPRMTSRRFDLRFVAGRRTVTVRQHFHSCVKKIMILFQRAFIVFAVIALMAIQAPPGRADEHPAMAPETGVTVQLPSGAVILLPAGDTMSIPKRR